MIEKPEGSAKYFTVFKLPQIIEFKKLPKSLAFKYYRTFISYGFLLSYFVFLGQILKALSDQSFQYFVIFETAQKIQINAADLPGGTYLLQFNDGAKLYSQKVIK